MQWGGGGSNFQNKSITKMYGSTLLALCGYENDGEGCIGEKERKTVAEVDGQHQAQHERNDRRRGDAISW